MGIPITSMLMEAIRAMMSTDTSFCIEQDGQSSGCPCLRGEQPPKPASTRLSKWSSIHLPVQSHCNQSYQTLRLRLLQQSLRLDRERSNQGNHGKRLASRTVHQVVSCQ